VNQAAVLVPPSPEAVRRTLAARSAEAGKLAVRAYSQTLEPRFPHGLALAAMGGFGRRELFPHAEAELALLFESESQMEAARDLLSAFLEALRDSGLRPRHSIHTVAECVAESENNAELAASLLDRRLLAGEPDVFEDLNRRFDAFLTKRAGAVARQLAGLSETRHARFQNTIYHLEPNLLETPGGLRDLQTVRWLAALDPKAPARDLTAAFDFLAGLRIRLHELAGRDQNVLDFAAQEAMSEHPASLMRDHYRHARLVHRTVRMALEAAEERPGTLIGRFHEWRSRLSTSEFTVSRDRV